MFATLTKAANSPSPLMHSNRGSYQISGNHSTTEPMTYADELLYRPLRQLARDRSQPLTPRPSMSSFAQQAVDDRG